MSEKNKHTVNHTPGRMRNQRGPGPGGQFPERKQKISREP